MTTDKEPKVKYIWLYEQASAAAYGYEHIWEYTDGCHDSGYVEFWPVEKILNSPQTCGKHSLGLYDQQISRSSLIYDGTMKLRSIKVDATIILKALLLDRELMFDE